MPVKAGAPLRGLNNRAPTQVQPRFVHPIVLRTWLAELIHALPWVAVRLPWLIRPWTLLTKSLSLAQAFPPPPLMAVSAAFSLASNPFFCVPVSEEALTLAIRFWITACGVSTVTVKLHDD